MAQPDILHSGRSPELSQISVPDPFLSYRVVCSSQKITISEQRNEVALQAEVHALEGTSGEVLEAKYQAERSRNK